MRRTDRVARYDANGSPLHASFVLADDEYRRWLVGDPEPRSHVPAHPETRAEILAQVVALQQAVRR